jgi:hypothetical protein
MAVLSDTDRNAGYVEFLNLRNLDRDALEITKPNVRAAFDALDDWVNSQQATINAAIPQPARAAMTTSQKAKLLIAVLNRRYLSGV